MVRCFDRSFAEAVNADVVPPLVHFVLADNVASRHRAKGSLRVGREIQAAQHACSGPVVDPHLNSF
eukprot:4630954-Heterocapsa_arctica.AAC.1